MPRPPDVWLVPPWGTTVRASPREFTALQDKITGLPHATTTCTQKLGAIVGVMYTGAGFGWSGIHDTQAVHLIF